MSCCGSKRQALNNVNSKISPSQTNGMEKRIRARMAGVYTEDTMFRYTGNGTLNVKSASSQRTYHFSQANHEVRVSGDDTAMMRAYPDLIELRN